MQILGLIVVGLIIGVLARLIVPGKQRLSMLATLLLGVAGAVIGGLIADWLDVGSITELNFWGFLFALIVAVLLIGVAAFQAHRRRLVQAGVAAVVAVAALVAFLTIDVLPAGIVSFTPHLITLLVLSLAAQRLRMPKADGLVYRRGEH